MSERPGRWTVDANVILRFVLHDNAVLTPRAQRVMYAMAEGETVLVCDPVTLGETVHVLVSVYNAPRDRIAQDLIALVEMDGFVIPEKDRYVRALRLFATEVPHFGDACACAAALEECDGRLYSFDRKLSDVPGIERAE